MPIKVLFVCLGNICRSPLAEAVFRQMVDDRGLTGQFEIDSAGTGSWHTGEPADRRARATADRHGCPTTHRARQVTARDFDHFDYVIAMDASNVENLKEWPGARPEKISLMLDWDPTATLIEVPDPYYGENDGFESVYDMLVPACEGLLNSIATPAPIS